MLPVTMNKASYYRTDKDFNLNSVFLKRIPDITYQKAVDYMANEYHFINGIENEGRMRLANYYVGIKKKLADQFVEFIHEVVDQIKNNKFPKAYLPKGFDNQVETLTDYEANGGFSFGSFDMAVTSNGLQVVEFQSIATYPFAAVKLNSFLREELKLSNAYIFANNKEVIWEDFKGIYQNIMGGENGDPVVLIDRNIKQQKTNFEFHATQKELGLSVKIVDVENVFEKGQELFFKTTNEPIRKIQRFYNRILPNEAIYDDLYPNGAKWSFRYDKSYKDLKFINHPCKLFEISKRLLPYMEHPLNPPALELIEAAPLFQNSLLSFSDFVWKHKDGAAGFSLILSPSNTILKELVHQNALSDYIAQRKINYHIFKTDDGLEKIVELRFMTAHTENSINIVPMARIGHCLTQKDGTKSYKIHFGDNNMLGYGFAPVLIF